MLGRSHGLSGLAAGLGMGMALHAAPLTCGLLAGVTALGAYVPDADHRNSTITRSVPVLGPAVSWVVRGLSRAVYAATKGPRDENCSGEHRHLSHTVVGAAVFGALVGVVVYVVAGRLGAADPRHLALLIGGGLALGCVTHCVGDALTRAGCPFLWPLPICGETWFELRPPRFLRFRTGGPVEHYLVFPALLVVTVLLIPGVWPIVHPLARDAVAALVTTLRR